MTEEQAAGSLFDPETFSSGGFLDDADIEIVSAKVGTWEHADGKCVVTLGMRKLDEEIGEDGPRLEYYTLGDLDKFTPSKDGTRAVYEPGTKLNGSVKWARFMKALINAGFPKASVSDDVRFVVGLRAHVNAIEMDIKTDSDAFKKRAGDKKKGDRKPSVVCVTKILALPGEQPTTPVKEGAAKKPASPAATAAAPAAVAAPAGGENSAATEAAEAAIVGVISENNGKATKRTLPNAMFTAVKDVELRKAAIKLCGNDAWLGDAARPWSYDAGKGELTLG